jgi:integrase
MTARGLAWQLGLHVEPHLGEYWVDAITPVDIRQWQSQLRSSGLAPATINSVHRSLRNIFDTAVADGLIAANPAKAVPMLREGRTRGPRGTVLTPEQLGAFLKGGAVLVEEGRIAPDTYTMLAILALCGLRFGELAAAKWSDLQDGMLHIERAVWNRHVDTTKTDDPRVVLVPKMALELLQIHRQRQIAEQHPALSQGLMFPSNPRQAAVGAKRRGTEHLNWYRYPSCVRPAILLIVDEAELPAISAHSLRRTWDRWTRWAGVDHMARRAMAGWRTEDAHAIYSNVDPEEARPAMEHALEKIMGGKG